MYGHAVCCSVRSPQWLRSKWWTLKRHVPSYQTLPFVDVLANLKALTLVGGRLRPNLGNAGLGADYYHTEPSPEKSGAATFRLCNSGDGYRLTPTIQLPDGMSGYLFCNF